MTCSGRLSCQRWPLAGRHDGFDFRIHALFAMYKCYRDLRAMSLCTKSVQRRDKFSANY